MVIAASRTGRRLQIDTDPPVGSGVREVGLWILISLGLFLMLALVTYTPQDPGWSYASPNSSNIQNTGGIIGAWGADVLVYLFGYLAFLFPIILIWRALLAIYLGDRNAFSSIHTLFTRWLGFAMTLIAGAMLAELYIVVQFIVPTPSGPGGVLGRLLTPLLLSKITPLGGVLALVFALLVGLTFLLKFSWLDFMEVLGAGVLVLLRPLLWPFRWLFPRKTELPDQDLAPIQIVEFTDLPLPKLEVPTDQNKELESQTDQQEESIAAIEAIASDPETEIALSDTQEAAPATNDLPSPQTKSVPPTEESSDMDPCNQTHARRS